MKHADIEAGKVYAIDPDGGAPSSNPRRNEADRNLGHGTKARAVEATPGCESYGRRKALRGWRFVLLEPWHGYRSKASGETVDIPSRAVRREWTEGDDAQRAEWQAQREADAALYARLLALGIPRKLTRSSGRFGLGAEEGDAPQGARILGNRRIVEIDREVLEGLLDRVEATLEAEIAEVYADG